MISITASQVSICSISKERSEDVEILLVRDLIEKRIGLACKNSDGFYIHIPASNNNSEIVNVDNFISTALDVEIL